MMMRHLSNTILSQQPVISRIIPHFTAFATHYIATCLLGQSVTWLYNTINYTLWSRKAPFQAKSLFYKVVRYFHLSVCIFWYLSAKGFFFCLVLTVGWMMDVCPCFRSVRMQSRIWKTACLCTTQKTTLAWRMPGISSKLRYAYTLNLWSVASEHYVSKQGFVILMSFLSSWQNKKKQQQQQNLD